MLKVLSFRFQQCVIPFSMLLLKVSPKTVLFRDLSKHVFGVPNFGNTSIMRVIFSLEMFKI